MSNQDKIKEIQDRISEKRNQKREITKDLDESIKLDEEELFKLETEGLPVVNGKYGSHMGNDCRISKCPHCGDTNYIDYNGFETECNVIEECFRCDKSYVVDKYEYKMKF